jgi:hypothetical protein
MKLLLERGYAVSHEALKPTDEYVAPRRRRFAGFISAQRTGVSTVRQHSG